MRKIDQKLKWFKNPAAISLSLLSATIAFTSPAYAWKCNSKCEAWQPDCYIWKRMNFSKCNRTDTYINDPQPSQQDLLREEMRRRQQIEDQERQERIRLDNLRRQQEEQRQQERLRQERQERERQILIQQNQRRREEDIKNLGIYLNNMQDAELPRCRNYADARVLDARSQPVGQGMSGSEMKRIYENAFHECFFPVKQRALEIYNREMRRINNSQY